jgi:hypothetical protein
MEKSKHTVTLPVADYVEMERAIPLVGVQEITKDHSLYPVIKSAMQAMYRNQSNQDAPHNMMDLFTFYVKKENI